MELNGIKAINETEALTKDYCFALFSVLTEDGRSLFVPLLARLDLDQCGLINTLEKIVDTFPNCMIKYYTLDFDWNAIDHVIPRDRFIGWDGISAEEDKKRKQQFRRSRNF